MREIYHTREVNTRVIVVEGVKNGRLDPGCVVR